MTFAYADPPYLGVAAKHYAAHHDDAAHYDTIGAHVELIHRLTDDYPDGWALSMTSDNLHDLLHYCPRDTRIAAWVKPFAAFKPNVNPAYAWEPVVFRGGRKRDRRAPTTRDYFAANITLKRGLPGTKPEAFNMWVLDLLGYEPGDELHDLFPGTGGMSAAVAQREGRAPESELFA